MKRFTIRILALVLGLALVPSVIGAPAITGADITTVDGAYKAGETITITTTYNETVTVTGGPPTLALNFNTRSATYSSGNNTMTLTWTYTIQAGDTSASVNATGINAIVLNGGTIQNGTGANADNTLPAVLLGSNAVVVDTTAPTVTVEQKTGQADPTSTDPILFTVTFSESVTGFTVGDVTVGGTSTGGTASLTGSGASYEISISGMTSDGTVTASIGAGLASDDAGNTNAASTSTDNTVTYDTSSSSSSSSSSSGDGGSDSSEPTESGHQTGKELRVTNIESGTHLLTFSGDLGVLTIDVVLMEDGRVGIHVRNHEQTPDDLPDGYEPTSFYLDIEQWVGRAIDQATITIGPFATDFLPGGPDQAVVLHKDDGSWSPLPTTVNQLPDGTYTVTFVATEFSPFALGSAIASTPPPVDDPGEEAGEEDPEAQPTPGFGASAMIAVLAAAVLTARRRQA